MQKELLGLAGLAVVVIAIIGVAAAVNDSDGDSRESGGDDQRVANPGDGSLAVCIEGAVDCGDTVEPGADPDEPVSNDPVTIIDDQDPNECNFVHNIDACERQASDLAVSELAARLSIEAETITVASAEFVQWPNACLGIENPDAACAEVITSGFKIVLEASGHSYEYHTDAGTTAFLVD